MILRLQDGGQLLVRSIRAEDKELLSRGLAGLSPQSAYRRFLSPKQRFSSGELRYLTEIDERDHVALVAMDPREPDVLVAVARFVRTAHNPAAAEAAIVIGDRYQGRGIGKLIALLLADEGRERGIERFEATILPENVAAKRLLAAMNERVAAPTSAAA